MSSHKTPVNEFGGDSGRIQGCLRKVLFPNRNPGESTHELELVTRWNSVFGMEKGQGESYSDEDGSHSMSDEYRERLAELKAETSSRVLMAFMEGDDKFFDRIGSAMRKLKKEKTSWPDRREVMFLKAALAALKGGGVVNKSKFAAGLENHSSKESKIDMRGSSELKFIQRLAKKHGIKGGQAHRPKSK